MVELGVVFDVSPNAYMVLDRDLRYVAANRAYCTTVKRRREDLIGRRVNDLFPHDTANADRLVASLRRVLETGQVDVVPVGHYRIEVDGRDEDRYWSASHTPLFDAHGRVEYVLQHTAEAHDVLARREVEAAQAELQTMFDSFPEALIAGTSTGVTRANQHALEMFGYRSADEILHHPISKVAGDIRPRSPLTREPIPRDELPFARALRGISTRMEMLITTVDTHAERCVFASGAPVIVDGVPTAAVAALVDITEQKRSENEVLKLARVLELMHDFVGIADIEGTPTYVNPAGLELMGLADLDAARALGIFEYLVEAERERARTEVVPAAMRNNYWEGEMTFKHARTGEPIPVLAAVFPMYDAAGGFTGLATITHDLRAQKHAEAERLRLLAGERTAREQAEQANLIKDQFLATVSHELRTPLTSILGWMQLLRAGMVTEDNLTRALDTIERNAKVQAQVIDDLLDVSRILSGKLALELEAVDIATIVGAAVETVRIPADAKSIRLDTAIESTAPIVGDARRLQQVVWNLLSNAVKFTPSGGRVWLRVERREDRLEIAVTDSGVGISPEFLPHVFERFRQADSSTTRHKSGLGLGLSIVQHVVSAHHGEVRAFSNGPGTGARFVVTLPIAVAPPTSRPCRRAEAIEPPTALAGRHVLVVDDDDDTREYVGALLRECGMRVDLASGADEALAAFEREHPDVVVSDLAMPEVDGYELIRSLRTRSDERGGRTPAIALTAFTRHEDRMRAMRAGFQNHVAKPVDPAELFAVLVAILR